MKKQKYLAALLSLALLGSCAENRPDQTTATTTEPVITAAPETADASADTDSDPDRLPPLSGSGETLEDLGNGVIDAASFEIFDQYFYGNWVYSGEHPEWDVWDVELGYSNDIPRYATNVLKNIYLDSDCAYLVLYTVMGDLVYTVPLDQPDMMYQYYDVTDYGSRTRGDYDCSYTKQELTEDDTLGYFGIRRLVCLEKDIPENILNPATLETEDGKSWVNFWEKITVLDRSEDKMTLKILCRADDGRNPFTPGYEEPLESAEILYTIERIGGEWSATGCEYGAPFSETEHD